MALEKGTVAVALINGQISLVRGLRSHSKYDRFLDVSLYKPIANNLFIAESSSSVARIFPTDLLSIFPDSDYCSQPDRNMLQLPQKAFREYEQLSKHNAARIENIWKATSCKSKIRFC